MQVVLRQDVDNLGLRGEVVNVARGYARNYLLPRGLAEVATPGLVAELARRDANLVRHQARSVDEAQAIVTRLESSEIRFDVKAGPTGSLFGSVTATSVADRLWETQKICIDRRKLELAPIKRVGRYTAPIEVFAGVSAELRLLVVPEGGELSSGGARVRRRRARIRQRGERRGRVDPEPGADPMIGAPEAVRPGGGRLRRSAGRRRGRRRAVGARSSSLPELDGGPDRWWEPERSRPS